MPIQMIGIDYEKANLNTRSAFSFNQENCGDALRTLTAMPSICGAVLLSTCNRTELYISSEQDTNLPALLCGLKQVKPEEFADCFVCRKESETVEHLFRLSCGMKSRVFGEDQILTQVKNALNAAREEDATDYGLEKLFMNAVTAAKKIKFNVHLTAVEDSVVVRSLNVLHDEFGEDLSGLRCMVIGNGMIGRMAARVLVNAGADVMMTVRSYKTRQVEIPLGCHVIDYKDRYSAIGEMDAIVSATTSPYCTVKLEECAAQFAAPKKRVFIDLAVPQDIDAGVAYLEGSSLYNIDTLGGANTGVDNEGVCEALEIISEYEDKFYREYHIREYLDRVHDISANGGEICYKRVEKELRPAVANGDLSQVEELVRSGTEKTVSSVLFCLKDVLSQEDWERCLEELEEKLQAF